MRVFTYFSFFLYVNTVVTLNWFRLESKITTIRCAYGTNQHYPPGTQENYNNFSSRKIIMGKGKELEFPEGWGGGKGEPTVPPRTNKPINNIVKTAFYNKKENEGCDMTRPSENEEENIIMLNKIKVNLKKQKILQQLESKIISNLDKLKMIEENEQLFLDKNKLMIDLSSGGLYNDFDFDFQ